VAEHLQRELGIEPIMVHGHLGEFKVLLDGEVLIDGGLPTALGILPSATSIAAAVQDRLAKN
jgi:hypothetical protein